MQIAVDPATNRIQVGVSYDANGNDLSNGGSYDIENRLLQATVVQTIKYAYAAGNKRIWRGVTGQLDEVAFWSVTGQKLATYNLVTQGQATQFVMAGQNVYFGGKLVAKGVSPNVTNLQPVASDRLGSIGKFYPYGQEINPTQGSSTEKFTGYFRDVETGLDYADQRYYEFPLGRFTSPDPSVNSGGAGEPGSWNRYAYVQGDPINYTDRRGLRRDDDDTDWGWGYGLIPSFSFGGGAHSIVLDWLNIAYGLCDDGEKGTAFREVVRPCIQAELLLLAAEAAQQRQASPACTVSVFSQSAVFSGDPLKHTYTEVQYAGQTAAPAQFLEGEPRAKNPGDKNGSLAPQWLNGFNDPAPLSSNSSTFLFSLGESQNACDRLVSLESSYETNHSNTITYNNWFPWTGPNSNSWTHSLLLAAGITGIPSLSNLQYPGWSNTGVPFP